LARRQHVEASKIVGGGSIDVKRPVGYFDPDGDMPETATVTITTPRPFADLTPQEYVERIRPFLDSRIEEAREEMISTARAPLGRKKCLDVDPFSSPTTDTSHREKVPLVSARDDSTRKTMLGRLKQFARDYRQALDDFRRGVATIFPAGTYWLRVFAAVDCYAPP